MGDVALKIAQIGLEDKYTSGANSVYNGGSAVAATRRLAVEKSVSTEFKFVWDAPQEARNSYYGNYQHVLQAIAASGKIPALVYCDDLVYYGRMAVSGTPTVTTLPSSPTALLAATAIAPTMSLTTQPNAAADGAAAKILAVTLANASPSSTAVNVTITGTDVYGNALSEVVAFSSGTTTTSYTGGGGGATTVTLYTKNYFKTVNAGGIATSAQPASDTVAVGGVNAFQYVFLSDTSTSTLYSATMEYFDGSAAWQLPGVVLEKLDLQMALGKSFKCDTTLMAQKKVQLAAASGSINPAATTGAHDCLTNLKDNIAAAIGSYKTLFYADPIGTAPGTTNIAARLVEWKMGLATGAKLGKAADGTPYPTFVGRDFYKCEAEFTLLFNSYLANTADPVELAQFLAGNSRTIRCALPGIAMPCGALNTSSNWPAALQQSSVGGYYGVMVDTPGKYEVAAEKDVDGRLALSFKQAVETDQANLGAPLQMTIISRVNPNQL